jgi:hypothetical protein
MSCIQKSSRSIGVAGAACLLMLLLVFVCPSALSQTLTQAPALPAETAPTEADTALPHGEIEYLWPEGAPGAVGTEEQDKPHLEIFRGYDPSPQTAVIVCPGSGYRSPAYTKPEFVPTEFFSV